MPGNPSLSIDTVAAVLREPKDLALTRLDLDPPGEAELVVDIDASGISTGTERLLWSGRMPDFPGMGYPLVPGYESVGTVRSAPPGSDYVPGDRVFVPGARCYGEIRGLFGGAARTVVVAADRVIRLSPDLGEEAVLLALAATAWHAMAAPGSAPPDLIVGHGVLGRLLARLAVIKGQIPVVWETNPARRDGALGYPVVDPDKDSRHDYAHIYDVSGDAALLDALIGRLCGGGEIVLAGFYAGDLSFAFAPAFMREARLRIAAEWRPDDMAAVASLAESKRLRLDGLISHRLSAADAADAYRIAFEDPACLKMILDWSVYR